MASRRIDEAEVEKHEDGRWVQASWLNGLQALADRALREFGDRRYWAVRAIKRRLEIVKAIEADGARGRNGVGRQVKRDRVATRRPDR